MANERKPNQRRATKQITNVHSKKGTTRRNASTAPSAPRSEQPKTKCQTCLDLLMRKAGASIEELQSLTGWQAHSVRGFLAGTIKKKMGLKIASEKSAKGARRYHVERAAA